MKLKDLISFIQRGARLGRLGRLNRFGRLAVLETFSATENTTFTHIIVLIADESLCSFPFDRNKIGKGSWFFGRIRGLYTLEDSKEIIN